MSKYDPLRHFLENIAPGESETMLSFREIENILGFPLPASARQYRQWWENPSTLDQHIQAQAWLAAGWQVDAVDQSSEWVRFRRSR